MKIKHFFQEDELKNNRGEERSRSHSTESRAAAVRTVAAAGGHHGRPSRTGWPQHVWALELKQ